MNPTTKFKGLLKNKRTKTTKARKVKVVKTYIPNGDTWNVIATILLVATLAWQFKGIIGWLTGATMVDVFGMSPVLATAIVKCPDILFYSTYFALGVSVIAFIVTAFVTHRFVCDEMDGCDALNTAVIGSMVTLWAFPVIHGCADLLATATKIRDTSGFDVFQLGIDIWPLLISTAVCVVIAALNKRVDILK